MASTLRALFTRSMFIAVGMGFSSGLPLLLTLSTLQAWMKDSGISLTALGFVSLVGLPYSLKFLWAPFLDRFVPPLFGRRRGWLLFVQMLLAIAIFMFAQIDPATQPIALAIAAFGIAFLSATQDIVADAYRRELFVDTELGLASAMFVNGYRIAMLIASGGALIMADASNLGSWPAVYMIMSGLMLVGMITTLLAKEPVIEVAPPKSFREAVIGPFVEYFQRNHALTILAFILLYKIGDTLASNMTIPFYKDIGFTNQEIGTIAKSWGFAASLIGGVIGGSVVHKLGIMRGLIFCGILQAITIPSFSVLALVGPSIMALTVAITLEVFTAGMGTSAYVAYMGSITNKKFSATQYALFSSLMAIPRNVLAAPTGWVSEKLTHALSISIGWAVFFGLCALAAVPGLLLIRKISKIDASAAQT